MGYANVLCAYDLSENAPEVLCRAIDIADKYAARLYVLHVMTEMDATVVNYVASVVGEERFAELELDHEAEVDEQLRIIVDHELNLALEGRQLAGGVSTEVHHGNPAEMILATVAKLQIDLVVLGRHGKGRVHTFLLGSVAEKVLKTLDRPVLVVPLGRA